MKDVNSGLTNEDSTSLSTPYFALIIEGSTFSIFGHHCGSTPYPSVEYGYN